MGKDKRISNRYDEYEISSVFAQSTEELMEKNFTPVRRRFLYKCILGPLLAINAYLSHWGPWAWPKSYWIFAFSVFFYYVGTFIYGKISVCSGGDDGVLIGEYLIDNTKTLVILKVSHSKMDYILELRDSQTRDLRIKKHFVYTDYFTISGLFLQSVYVKHLTAFLKFKEEKSK